MGKIHTIQLNIGDFLGGTAHMDATEIGAYWSLLLASYQAKDNSLPNDPNRLHRMAKCSGKVWGRISGTVLEKFTPDPTDLTKLIHKRVLEDAQKYLLRSADNTEKVLKYLETKKPTVQPDDELQFNNPIPNTQESKLLTPESLTARGFSDSGFGKKGFDIRPMIDDDVLEACRRAAPQWDIQGHLAGIYNEGINSGARERPRCPKKAFPAWCARYTKGKPPS